MNSKYCGHIFRCPKCRSELLWSKKKCACCGTPFQIRDNLFDFVEGRRIEAQGKVEVALHQSLTEEYEKRYQDAFSKVYSNYWNQQFISKLPDDCGMILDCGCGTGDLIREILPCGRQIVGMDISRDMIRVAKNIIADEKKVIWVASPGETFPFADEIFDVICFRGALHHMTHETLALKEAHRTLRTGGTLMISEPNDDSLLLRFPGVPGTPYLIQSFSQITLSDLIFMSGK